MQNERNTTRIRRELLVKIARLYFENRLFEEIDYLPIQMRPRKGGYTRCCIYKERAVLKYRSMAILGFSVENETDELTPLSQYAWMALERKSVEGPVLTVLDEACSSCVKTKYFITNACQGCFARPCTLNCPKKCIQLSKGQSSIDPERCINCGRCMQVCPYHAVVHIPIPCEEECPVGAITKSEDGTEVIDDAKCIHCGKCITACPFGAIMEKSQIIDVLKNFSRNRPVVAMIAPAIAGQFAASLENIIGALKTLGFSEVIEVATGADITAKNEAYEFSERMNQGESFMTSSCCPAYTEAVKKHMPEVKPFVSNTSTPLHYTAELVNEQYPEAVKVFISPCVAKRQEVLQDPLVDYTLTFEELAALFVAKGIQVESCEPSSSELEGLRFGRGFPVSGGVASAMEHFLNENPQHPELKVEKINGLNRIEIKKLKSANPEEAAYNFLEVMCCEGGCVAGPCVIANPKRAARSIEKLSSK